ncbi:MAG: tRNA (adenosine(37)-N6)-dimethylallyltransferase MiaA [Deltaproteobacteria bacterium]|nr:tRNA (adenosine(37)-N6)-dimethylallyltransferase MiaA [Deltaproteobacteria bacterium]
MAKQKILILVGPTGVGKTDLSLGIAEKFQAEIISMDSMQIYRHMDIGTAKPTLAERCRVPHHLVDYVEPDEIYHVSRFVKDARQAIEEISSRGLLPMLVGGTGLYMRGLLEGVFALPVIPGEVREKVRHDLQRLGNAEMFQELSVCDPESAARIHPNDSQRLARGVEIFRATGIPWSQHLRRQDTEAHGYEVVKVGLQRERRQLYERINSRVDIMIEQGLLAEVENLLAMGFGPELGPMQSIGYRHMVQYIVGAWPWQEAVSLLARDSRRYAKRQFTWFGRDQDIEWFHPDQWQKIVRHLERKGF